MHAVIMGVGKIIRMGNAMPQERTLFLPRKAASNQKAARAPRGQQRIVCHARTT